MKPLYKGLAIAFIHILIILSLGGKLLYDRATRPRVWVRTVQYDPDLPIRGRYLSMSLEVHAPDVKIHHPYTPKDNFGYTFGYMELSVENNELVAHKTERDTGIMIDLWQSNRFWWRHGSNPRGQPDTGNQPDIFVLSTPVLFFLPEHAEVPRVFNGDEMWAEVTVPKKGPPRPIQLALKHNNQWTPLTYR